MLEQVLLTLIIAVYYVVCISNNNTFFRFLYFFRYGSCIPFSLSPTLNFSESLCEGVYQKGKDYVYISKQKTVEYYTNILNAIGEMENFLKENFVEDECTNTTLRMICHYYLPPCGNSTYFEHPTSVCEAACEQQSEKCQSLLDYFKQRAKFNCSTSILDPLPHSCSNLRFDIISK